MRLGVISLAAISVVTVQGIAAQQIAGLEREVVLGGALGTGSGPSPVSFVSASIAVAPLSGWAVEGTVDTWSGGFGVACTQSFPESYACDASGWSGRVGLVVFPVRIHRVFPYGEVGGGIHVRRGPVQQRTESPMGALAVGVRALLGSRMAARAELEHQWVLDEPYEDLMGEDLRLLVFSLGLDLRISR